MEYKIINNYKLNKVRLIVKFIILLVNLSKVVQKDIKYKVKIKQRLIKVQINKLLEV